MPTTAAIASLATGTAIRTMLQISTPSTKQIEVVKWGVEFPTPPTAPVLCELVETGAVGATALTAHAASGVQPYDNPDAPASLMTLGTGNTGFWVSGAAEGTITATRYADIEAIPIGVGSYTWEWSLGRGFVVGESRFLRVRMTTATTVNAIAWVLWSE